VLAPGEQLRRDAGRRLEAVGGAAGETDRVDRRQLRTQHRGGAAADVGREGGALREREHGAAGRTLFVLGDADREAGELEGEHPSVKGCPRLQLDVVVGAAAHAPG